VADTEWVFWEWDDPLIYNFELKVTDNGHLDSDPTVGTITLKYPYFRAMTTAKITQTAAGGSYAPAAKAIYGRISEHGGPITLGSTFIDQLADGRILYDGNGNTNTGEETEGAEQSGQATKVIPAAENTFFTRDGYTFSGWNTAADGEGDQIQPGDDVVFSKGDRVLYAQWEKSEVLVAPAPGVVSPSDKPVSPVEAGGVPVLAKTGSSSLAFALAVMLLGVMGTMMVVTRRLKH